MNRDVLREDAQVIFQAGVAAADPYLAVKRHFQAHSGVLSAYSTVHLIAFGKAACAMAEAAQEMLPVSQRGQALAVTNYENVRTVPHVDVLGAAHPLPDAQGFLAAEKVIALAQQAQATQCVLVLISGGGSALLPYPAFGLTLEEKIITTNLLLSSGATIQEMNCVRKHLSQIKGGGLAKFIAPAACYALILSDVLDDDLSVIASGTTVGDNTTFLDAVVILKNKRIWDVLPAPVKHHLEQGVQGHIAETPKPHDKLFERVTNTLIGSNIVSVNAMVSMAQQLGYHTICYQHPLCGEARDVAVAWVEWLNTLSADVRQGEIKRLAVLTGGETTVTLKGTGQGGRNQEMALAFAIASQQLMLEGKWLFLSAGTDGIDGCSPAAGGIVNAQTLSRIEAAQLSPQALLNNNDSYHALSIAGDVLVTGATGTNVADLQVFLFEAGA